MQFGAMAATTLVGAALALQVGMAATMRNHAGSPMAAALVNFAVGTIFLFIAVALGRGSLSGLLHVGAAPWWAEGRRGGDIAAAQDAGAPGPPGRRADLQES